MLILFRLSFLSLINNLTFYQLDFFIFTVKTLWSMGDLQCFSNMQVGFIFK